MLGEIAFGDFWVEDDEFSIFGWFFVKPAISGRISRAVMMVVSTAVSMEAKDGNWDEKTEIFFEFSLVVNISCFWVKLAVSRRVLRAAMVVEGVVECEEVTAGVGEEKTAKFGEISLVG